ncbi:MAG TPA: hypothetical protein VEG29_04300 [Candidatus Binatia bacterium]|nr:hypothetical protein [Candidatus Binatia bacterium]
MTEGRPPLSDRRIEAGLARQAPRGPDADLLSGIVAAAARTRQASTWWPPQRPSAMTPRARLVWVAILIALSLAVGGLLVAAGSARHDPDLAVTLQETPRPSDATSPALPSPSPRPSPSPTPTPTGTTSPFDRRAPRSPAPSPCDVIRVLPASQAGPTKIQPATLRGDATVTGAYVALTSPTMTYGAADWTTARGGELWVADGPGAARRVAIIEGPGSTFPVVSDESPDRSRALLAVGHGSADGSHPDCVELFEVRTDDGVATALWTAAFDPSTWTVAPGDRGYVGTAYLAQQVAAEYSPTSDAISYATPRGDPTTVGLVIDGVDRTMRVQSTFGGPFASPGPRDVYLDRGTATTALACVSQVSAPGAWSPSGDTLALLCDGGIAIVDPVAGTGRAVRTGAEALSWTPTGEVLAAVGSGYRNVFIESIDPVTGSISNLGSAVFGVDGSSVGPPIEFSPDGRMMLVEVAGADGEDLAAVPSTGGVGVPVVRSTDLLGLPSASWSADSSAVVYVTPAAGSAERALRRVTVSTRASSTIGQMPASYGSGVWRVP